MECEACPLGLLFHGTSAKAGGHLLSRLFRCEAFRGAPVLRTLGRSGTILNSQNRETPYIQRRHFRRRNCTSSLWANDEGGPCLQWIEGGNFLEHFLATLFFYRIDLQHASEQWGACMVFPAPLSLNQRQPRFKARHSDNARLFPSLTPRRLGLDRNASPRKGAWITPWLRGKLPWSNTPH
jgi:hypothetical protein